MTKHEPRNTFERIATSLHESASSNTSEIKKALSQNTTGKSDTVTGEPNQSRASISSPAARPTPNTPKPLKGDRQAVPVLMSSALKEAIEIEAEQQGISTSELIRRSIAATLGYDLAGEAKYRRSSVYATPEDRKRAERDRARERRHLAARLVREHREKLEREEKAKAIRALETSLGLDPE